MGAQQGLMVTRDRLPSSKGLIVTAATSLLALAYLLASGGSGGPLHSAVAAARLRWYVTQGRQAARPPGLHGLVRKEGAINTTFFYPPHGPPCKADRLRWYEQAAAAAGTLGHADLAVLQRGPCMPCQVYVNHLYRVIYVRHPKVASSTVLDHFGLCPDELKGCLHALEMDMSTVTTSPEARASPFFRQLSQLSVGEVAALWRQYLVFTVTRDPLDRAVSQYSFLMRSNLADPPGCAAAANQQLSWDRFCSTPASLARFCARCPDCCKQAEDGVSYDGVGFKLAHIRPQAPCMTTPGGGLAVDFVARQEHLGDDMGDLVDAINARRGKGVPALQLGAQLGTAKMRARCASGRSGAAAAHGAAEMEQGAWRWQGMVAREQYCTTDEYYAGRHAHCRASVAAYYADDLRLLYGSG